MSEEENQPDLMSALKASLDAVKTKHDERCTERRRFFPLICSCGVSDDEFESVKDRIGRSEMTPAQSLAHRYAAEAGRRSDALKAFRECMRYAAVAEANGDTISADLHRADARACLHLYPETLQAIDRAVGG